MPVTYTIPCINCTSIKKLNRGLSQALGLMWNVFCMCGAWRTKGGTRVCFRALALTRSWPRKGMCERDWVLPWRLMRAEPRVRERLPSPYVPWDLGNLFTYSQCNGFFQELCTDVRVGPWRRLSTEELMISNCGAEEESWESLGQQEDQTSQS